MIRNLKTLGLALVAIFAMSAMAASAASAAPAELTTEGAKSVTLDIEEKAGGEDINALTAFGRATQCPGTTYTGHKVLTHAETTEEKVHELIPNKSTTVTITPKYAKCTLTGGFFGTVKTNGCDFVFHIDETNPANTYPVTADVVCPNANEGIHLTVYSNEAHTSTICTIEVTPQTGLKGAHVINEPAVGITKDDLRVTGTFKNLHVERTGLCIFDGQGTTTTEGEFDINVTVKGTDSEKQPLGITVTD